MLTKEIESWNHGGVLLTEKEKQVMKMLNDCYKYSTAINAKGQPFPSEGAIMSLLLSQHKLIEWLENQWGKKLWDVKNGNDTTGPSSVTIEKYPFIYIV